MACRYFSCSRLLEESEDEAGAKGRRQHLLSMENNDQHLKILQIDRLQTIDAIFWRQNRKKDKLIIIIITMLCMHTCWRGVLWLEQSHHTLAMKTSWAKQDSFGVGVFPTHNRQTVVSVAAGHFLQTAVLYCLRNHEQPRITDRETQRRNLKYTKCLPYCKGYCKAICLYTSCKT